MILGYVAEASHCVGVESGDPGARQPKCVLVLPLASCVAVGKRTSLCLSIHIWKMVTIAVSVSSDCGGNCMNSLWKALGTVLGP